MATKIERFMKESRFFCIGVFFMSLRATDGYQSRRKPTKFSNVEFWKKVRKKRQQFLNWRAIINIAIKPREKRFALRERLAVKFDKF